MAGKNRPLGFNCPGCGRDYYCSIEFIPKPKTTNEGGRKYKPARSEPDQIKEPKRSTLHPVQYALTNALIVGTEEEILYTTTKVLAELRRNGWQLLPPPFSPPLSESERRELETYVSELKSRVEARKRQRQLEEEIAARKEPAWDVTEKVEEIDPSTYEIMKKLSMFVGMDELNTNEGGEIIDNTSNNHHNIIKWNPMTMIRKYRNTGDLFCQLDIHMDFYAKVLAKYYHHTKYFLENYKEVLTKAFDIVDKYRKPFYDINYRYTWYEWFWIVRYAQAFTPRRAAQMLLALDGDGGKGEEKGKGRIIISSLRHINDMKDPVMEFWHDYFYYVPYFFHFLNVIDRLVERDPELKNEYNKILEESDKDDYTFFDKVLGERCLSLEINNPVLKAVKIGPERIRIRHINENYQKEMEEFNKNDSRKKEKPSKMFVCTFSPSKLPVDERVKLHKEGKVPIIQGYDAYGRYISKIS